MARTTITGSSPGFVADWNSVQRNDGRQIDFSKLGPDYEGNKYTVKANGGGLRVLTEGRRPDWSPDGRRIVFDTGTGLPGSVPGIGTVNADGTHARLLANSGTEPKFSPDGAQIVFTRGGEIWTMNADGSDQEQLTRATEPDFGAVWSPTGRMIAFLRGTPSQLYVMNVDGTDPRPLAPSPAWELDPDWSPGGRRISFARCLA